MIIQPGQGLGFTGSKQIAFGLGGSLVIVEDVAVLVHSGSVAWDKPEKRTIKLKRPDGKAIHRDDEEILELLVKLVASGIL